MMVLMITFSVVAANHLGLVAAVEGVTGRQLPIVNCVKCGTFWAVLGYGIYGGDTAIYATATAFLASWMAVWMELMMGAIDKLYLKIYDAIYTTTDDGDADTAGTDDALSCVRDGEAW